MCARRALLPQVGRQPVAHVRGDDAGAGGRAGRRGRRALCAAPGESAKQVLEHGHPMHAHPLSHVHGMMCMACVWHARAPGGRRRQPRHRRRGRRAGARGGRSGRGRVPRAAARFWRLGRPAGQEWQHGVRAVRGLQQRRLPQGAPRRGRLPRPLDGRRLLAAAARDAGQPPRVRRADHRGASHGRSPFLPPLALTLFLPSLAGASSCSSRRAPTRTPSPRRARACWSSPPR